MMNLGPSRVRLLHALSGAFLLILTACGTGGKDATPTIGAEAVFTFAAQTFEANLSTQAALVPPTDTPAPTPTQLPAVPTLPPLSVPTIAFESPTPLLGGGAACSDAAFVADVTIPDKTRLDPGQKFSKTWRVQNIGTCPWNTSYKLTFHNGLQMGGDDVYVPLPVPVGQQVDLTEDLRAPTSPGDYFGRWQLQDDQERPFGSILSVVIKVVSLTP